MQSTLSALRKRPCLSAFITAVLGFAIPYVYLLIVNVTQTHYDAWYYAEQAKAFTQGGLLNIRAYAESYGTSYRGYLLPWLIALGECLSSVIPFLNYRFLISVFASVICTLALPAVIEGVFQVKFAYWKRPLLLIPLIYLFRGAMTYPLSDLWAAGCAVTAVWALIRLTEKTEKKAWRRYVSALLLGVSLAAAYNIRTINLILIFSVGACLIVLFIRRREIPLFVRLISIPCVLAGFILISLPQMLINYQCFQSLSPLLISPEGSSLFINQLYDGMYISKYESYIGYDYWEQGMNYFDRAGLAIFERCGFEATGTFGTGAEALKGIGDYIKLFFKYPLDFIGIYSRHFINLLDIRYPEIYVENIYADHLVPIVNYLLIYFSASAFMLELRRREKGTFGMLWLLFALLLPTFAILAGAIETRFSIVLMLLLWGCLFGLTRKELFKGLRARSWVALAVGLVGFVIIMTAVAGDTMAGFADWTMLY